MVKVVGTEVNKGGAFGDKVVSNDQDGRGDGDSGAFFARAGSKAAELGGQVVVVGMTSGEGGLA